MCIKESSSEEHVYKTTYSLTKLSVIISNIFKQIILIKILFANVIFFYGHFSSLSNLPNCIESTEASTSRGGHNLRLRKSLNNITNFNAHMERKDDCLPVKSNNIQRVSSQQENGHVVTKLNKFMEFKEEDRAPIKKRKIAEPSPILLNELKDPGQRVSGFFLEFDITITSINKHLQSLVS